MELNPRAYPKPLRQELLARLDAALPDCYWKRRFVKLWENFGLQGAWDIWRAEAPIVNPSFVPKIEETIQELLQWPFAS